MSFILNIKLFKSINFSNRKVFNL